LGCLGARDLDHARGHVHAHAPRRPAAGQLDPVAPGAASHVEHRAPGRADGAHHQRVALEDHPPEDRVADALVGRLVALVDGVEAFRFRSK